jgi:hypothetical protein
VTLPGTSMASPNIVNLAAKLFALDPSLSSAQRAHDLVERLEIALEHAVVTDFAVAVALGNRDVDRFFVDIQPYEHATVLHDLPPRLWLCDAVRQGQQGKFAFTGELTVGNIQSKTATVDSRVGGVASGRAPSQLGTDEGRSTAERNRWSRRRCPSLSAAAHRGSLGRPRRGVVTLFEPYRDRPVDRDQAPAITDLRIRPALLGDVAELGEIDAAREGGGAAASASKLKRAITSYSATGQGLVLVAEHRGRLAAIAKACRPADELLSGQ